MIITQTVGEDIRSEEMSIIPDSKFQCANTTCLPFISVTTTDIRNCQFACLGQSQCIAATFHRSTSDCELFDNMLNQNGNMLADVDATSMDIITGTRFPPGQILFFISIAAMLTSSNTTTSTTITSVTTTTTESTSTTTITAGSVSISSTRMAYYATDDIFINCSTLLTNVTIQITVSKTVGATFSGGFTTFPGGQINQYYIDNGTDIIYTWTIISGQTINCTISTYQIEAQYQLVGTSQPNNVDSYTIILETSSGGTTVNSGYF
ncbi:unnamed protein product [Adineta steineri]|uniref:Apple domain-containing protein n=1 Tax=Adineta steineri TaxID=433720 RepID=A0A819TCB1_9BILA|nr:unnamed protein product [Adineta steineri]